MAEKKEIVVTEDGLRKLHEEIDDRRSAKRREIVEAIRAALSFGDISENSEYDEAKDEQAKNEARIAELEEILKNVRVVPTSEISTETVGIGTAVKVFDEEFEEEIEYQIVGSNEANPIVNKISDRSPIGKALLGRSVGDVALVSAPAGTLRLKIISIRLA
ncbi:MAG: transcription elongation factor GreA [Clostridia bacterium]|nr:transcription elongation factor GreA [Clostridia bacterium]